MVRKITFRESIAENVSNPMAAVINLEREVEDNYDFKKMLWLGKFFEIRAMSIPNGDAIGIEVHPDSDQFIKIESGRARISFGKTENEMTYERIIDEDYGVAIPAGTWHNVTNIGDEELKLFTVYAPPH